MLIWQWWLLNLNHFWIAQPDLCLKVTFVKASFMFVTIFLDIYENPRTKNFINFSCSKHKKWHKFLKISSFWRTKKKCESKKFMSFFPLIPLGLHFVELLIYAISVSLTTEIQKNNIDTFKVTSKQHHKIMLF